jgi:hypothetical protein
MRLGDPVEGRRPRNHVFRRVGDQIEQDHADAERLVARDPLPEAAAGKAGNRPGAVANKKTETAP